MGVELWRCIHYTVEALRREFKNPKLAGSALKPRVCSCKELDSLCLGFRALQMLIILKQKDLVFECQMTYKSNLRHGLKYQTPTRNKKL